MVTSAFRTGLGFNMTIFVVWGANCICCDSKFVLYTPPHYKYHTEHCVVMLIFYTDFSMSIKTFVLYCMNTNRTRARDLPVCCSKCCVTSQGCSSCDVLLWQGLHK